MNTPILNSSAHYNVATAGTPLGRHYLHIFCPPVPGATEGSVTIATGKLPAGLYTCTLWVGGRPVGTRKLFIIR